MALSAPPKFWIFSNKPNGTYKDLWDMDVILETRRYSLKASAPNRQKVKAGDAVYMRVYSQGFIGRFTIADEWTPVPKREQRRQRQVVGTFPMKDIEIWSHPVPASLIFSDLSNQNHRMRVA